MPTILAENWINVRRGQPAFVVSSNVCDWFEIGQRTGNDYWLEGSVVGDGEFVFNGRLFVRDGGGAGTMIDNFPRAAAPQGWTKHAQPDSEGYKLVADDGTVLFAYSIVDRLCLVAANLYAANNDLIAESLPGEFRLHRGPARIGRNGIVFD